MEHRIVHKPHKLSGRNGVFARKYLEKNIGKYSGTNISHRMLMRNGSTLGSQFLHSIFLPNIVPPAFLCGN